MTKERFCEILGELQAGEDLQRKVAAAVRQYNNLIHSDYPEPYGLVISHEFRVIELLAEIMGDTVGDIENFCMELDFGRKYTPGCVTEVDGSELDFSSAEKVYDYLDARKK